jgi:ankyrin repeat protein
MGTEAASSIHHASLVGDLNRVSDLVNRGNSVNSFDNAGLTPLHYAILTKNIEMVVRLAQLGAEINVGTRNKNQAPAHFAAEVGSVDCLMLLSILGCILTVQDNTEEGKMPIHTTVKYNQAKAMLWLLKNGVSVDARDRKGGTPLFYAIKCRHSHLVHILIEEGADVNIKCTGLNNITPLHMAVSEGNLDTILMLLMSGANMYLTCNTRHETPFHWAAREGGVFLFEVMCNFGPILSIKTGDEAGNHPIHLAVREGHLPLVEWLVDKGISVNCTNSKGYTPLHTAAYYHKLDIALYLLQEGSQVYARTKKPHFFTTLTLAVQSGKLDMVDLLMHYGSNINAKDPISGYTSLHHAVIRDNLECLKHLKNNGGNVMIYMEGENREPLIVTAAINGSINVARWILETAVSANTSFAYGRTALHYAVDNSQREMAQLLLKRAADVNCKCNRLWTPLHFAVAAGDLDMVGFLISWKADLEAQSYLGCSAVCLAALNNNEHCLQLLAAAGADITKPISFANGEFLLHVAAANGHEKIANWLIRNGMCVDVRSRVGMTALMVASNAGHYGTAKLLLGKGANVNAKVNKSDNKTALHFSSVGRNSALAQLLIENGADINAGARTDARTPLEWAIKYNCSSIIELLRHYGAHRNGRDSYDSTAANFGGQ